MKQYVRSKGQIKSLCILSPPKKMSKPGTRLSAIFKGYGTESKINVSFSITCFGNFEKPLYIRLWLYRLKQFNKVDIANPLPIVFVVCWTCKYVLEGICSIELVMGV